jgi:hypothetical protein
VPLQGLLEKEVKSRHAVLHGPGRQLLVALHVQLELADRPYADLTHFGENALPALAAKIDNQRSRSSDVAAVSGW